MDVDTSCDYVQTKTVYTYGTVVRSAFGARGYTCSCLKPREELTGLRELLEYGSIPADQLEGIRERIRKLE